MKKIWCSILTIVLLFSVAACSNGTENVAEVKAETSSKNTILWPADFYGVVIPAPDGYSKVAVLESEIDEFKNEVTTVRIDGVKYDEYVKYCKKLESLKGWIASTDVSPFPEELEKDRYHSFRGGYDILPRVVVGYFGEDKVEENGKGYPLQIFVFKTF